MVMERCSQVNRAHQEKTGKAKCLGMTDWVLNGGVFADVEGDGVVPH
jgi:hypothetical protein